MIGRKAGVAGADRWNALDNSGAGKALAATGDFFR